MKRRSEFFAVVLGFFGFAANACGKADAADMPYGYGQTMPVQEFVSGWYLRGDIGWRTDTKIGDIAAINPLSIYNYALPTNAKLDDIAMFGIGAGYKLNWLRLDVTTDYAGKANFKGDYVVANQFSGRFDTWTMLANAYIDLGTWSGLTPYVGAGVGFVTFRASDYVSPVAPQTTLHQTQTELAWAYMAGVAWCFAPKWMVDFSYRHIGYGDVTFNPPLANPLQLRDLSANEFRIGVRYTLD
ncbi:MAG: outer membrane beta-barrel protein [Pseudorhodoplanes sp.]